MKTDHEWFVERIERQAGFWDSGSTPMPFDLIWWWLQGAKFCAEGEDWDVLVDLQQVVQALLDGEQQ